MLSYNRLVQDRRPAVRTSPDVEFNFTNTLLPTRYDGLPSGFVNPSLTYVDGNTSTPSYATDSDGTSLRMEYFPVVHFQPSTTMVNNFMDPDRLGFTVEWASMVKLNNVSSQTNPWHWGWGLPGGYTSGSFMEVLFQNAASPYTDAGLGFGVVKNTIVANVRGQWIEGPATLTGGWTWADLMNGFNPAKYRLVENWTDSTLQLMVNPNNTGWQAGPKVSINYTLAPSASTVQANYRMVLNGTPVLESPAPTPSSNSSNWRYGWGSNGSQHSYLDYFRIYNHPKYD